MHLTPQEEYKHNLISFGLSLFIFLMLILFLIYYTIITPNPPFPLSSGGGGTEINFGTYDEGTGTVESNGIGDATSVVAHTEVTPPTNMPQENNEAIFTSEQGEEVNLTETKPKIENHVTVITPTKPVEVIKPKTQAELLAEKFNKNKGKTGGGDGHSGQAGNEGEPDGNPNTHGSGGTGGGEDRGDGPDKGIGKGPGPKGYGFSLAGRAVVSPPALSKDTKEEGKVVVEITVDKNGSVIKADPNGRGTTTNSAILKAKARQAALATKFNVSKDFEEQKGTITIVFSF